MPSPPKARESKPPRSPRWRRMLQRQRTQPSQDEHPRLQRTWLSWLHADSWSTLPSPVRVFVFVVTGVAAVAYFAQVIWMK